jgi:hypothetical protein
LQPVLQDMWQLQVLPVDVGNGIVPYPIANVDWNNVELPPILVDDYSFIRESGSQVSGALQN